MRLYLFSLLIIATLQQAWAVKPQVAVLDLDGGSEITTGNAQVLTDELQNKLLKKNVFQLLERSQIQSILSEQGFQESGACSENDCQVEIGKMLSVQQLVLGSISKFDNLYILSTRMVDVESGQILQSSSVKVDGKLNELLIKGVPVAADQLSAPYTGSLVSLDTVILGKEYFEKVRIEDEVQQEKSSTKRSSSLRSAGKFVTALAGFAGLAAGAYYRFKANDQYQNYSAYEGTSAENQVGMNESWDKVDKNVENSNLGLMVMGASLLGYVVFSINF